MIRHGRGGVRVNGALAKMLGCWAHSPARSGRCRRSAEPLTNSLQPDLTRTEAGPPVSLGCGWTLPERSTRRRLRVAGDPLAQMPDGPPICAHRLRSSGGCVRPMEPRALNACTILAELLSGERCEAVGAANRTASTAPQALVQRGATNGQRHTLDRLHARCNARTVRHAGGAQARPVPAAVLPWPAAARSPRPCRD
jgi:hypothetical protein